MRLRSPVLTRKLRPFHGAILAATAGLVALAACGEPESKDPPRRPNVVLIVIDTLRADVLLRQSAATPNLMALARDGVVFRQAFSHAPMTLPSHTSLFASQLPFETGVMVNGSKVPSDLPLLPERFQASGYRTSGVISLATLASRVGEGLDRSFETYDMSVRNLIKAPEAFGRLQDALSGLESNQPFFLFAHFSDPHEPYNAHGTTDRSAQISIDGEPVDVVSTSDSTNWHHERDFEPGEHVVELRSEEPFLLRLVSCSGKDLEVEWETEATLKARLEARAIVRNTSDGVRAGAIVLWMNDALAHRETVDRYMLEVEFADRYVGELIRALRERGLYDTSIIAFTSDHGEGLGDHGTGGHARNLYDELIHVPLIIKPFAGDRRKGELEARRDQIFPLVDLGPTLLDLAGVPAMPSQRGRSVLGQPEEPRVHIAETHKPEAPKDLVCARDGRFKMVLDAEADTFEMYDLHADPKELRDVFDERRSERPDWPELLRGIARAAAVVEVQLDEEASATLRALGYVDGDGE